MGLSGGTFDGLRPVVYDEILDEYREKKNMNDIVITREWVAAGIN